MLFYWKAEVCDEEPLQSILSFIYLWREAKCLFPKSPCFFFFLF
jgi:hypothetical protein